MNGLGRKMPITYICFLIGTLSIIGLPPLGGVWSKWYLALGAAETHQVVFVAVLMISSLLNVAYLVPIVVRGFCSDPDPDDHHHDHHDDHHGDGHGNPGDAGAANTWQIGGYTEAPAACVGALTFTAFGCFVLFFYADAIFGFLSPLVQGGAP